ncbi:MAG: helix-turn-helix domain-containing protein [Acidimicrobiia bacterium]
MLSTVSMRPDEVAAVTGLSAGYVRKLIRAGKLEARHVGRAVVVPIAAVEALIEGSPRVVAEFGDGNAAA